MNLPERRKWLDHTYVRVFLFASTRALALFLAIAVSLSLTILVTSRSGVLESELKGSRIKGWLSGPSRVELPTVTPELDETASPFVNFVSLLVDGLTFNFTEGPIFAYYFIDTTNNPLQLVLDSLTRTVALFGTASLLVFVCSLFLALSLSHRYGSVLDKVIIGLSPLSSIPAWIYALGFTILLAKGFGIFPGHVFNQWPEEWDWASVQAVLKAFGVPVFSIFLSKFFQATYTWRTLFLIQSGEEYVELAKAKGMSERSLNRRYILRPALPYVITNFSMMLINTWQEAILMEVFFGISGIGHLFYEAMRNPMRNMVFLITLAAVFAYLLASNVFILDILYALIDPRVRIGRQSEKVKSLKPSLSLRSLFSRSATFALDRVPDPPQAVDPLHSTIPASPVIQHKPPRPRLTFEFIKPMVRNLIRYPTAIFSLAVILFMLVASVYTLIKYPFEKTVSLWRSEENVWEYNPKLVPPAWINLFRTDKLPITQILTLQNGATQTFPEPANGMQFIDTVIEVDYPYGSSPQEITLKFSPEYIEKRPFLTVTWLTPDGRTLEFGNYSLSSPDQRFVFSQDERLARKLKTKFPVNDIFLDPETQEVVQGTYQMRIQAIFFEESFSMNPELVIYGKAYGLAGTDNHRRDLILPLLWGMPIALSLGVVGAIGGTLFTLWLAAVGSWFGGIVDRIIQALTEINMVLPAFPLMVFVFINYSKSIWVILTLALILSIGGSAIKNYRAAFLQIREAAYIESPQVYGASDWRIIFVYLIPRLLPVMVPQLVGLIPGIFFLETTLAYLNISDPVLPTWGKLMQEALAGGALNGAYFWILEPLGMLLVCGLSFALLGFALDRVLNPRLREH
ncbi:MAG: ABC transporter permease subunit [Anaerolineales bacterium]|jgi:peptide/nickel transport system permease protein|nr:ABC transporter permease subunit [Anaerolineales bacterium]